MSRKIRIILSSIAEVDRSPRSAALIAAALATIMIPWCVYLATTLPARVVAERWTLAWTGLDAAEAISAGLTAILLWQRRPQASLTAALGAGFLLTDAWFDTCTAATGHNQQQALMAAVLMEIPLAVLALWFAGTNLTQLERSPRPRGNLCPSA